MGNPEIDETTMKFLSYSLYAIVSKEFEKPSVRKDFEAFYLGKYGVPYKWKSNKKPS